MKAEELRNLDGAEARAKEAEMREQMFRLRFQLAMGQTDGLRKYRALKKDLARLLTVQREREQAS
ncbi:MAG: 50S ribosomal protein L29 [Acidobacteria bacterium]|nr:50S ribosomal protein L29 [Acidobacteriota bacterium]